MAKDQIEITIKKYLNAIQSQNIKIHKAFLYGSYAKGNYKNDSDIDIAIISPDFGHDYLHDGVKLKLATIGINSSISPRPYSVNDLKNTRPGDFLHDEILKKGKEIPLS